MQTLLARALGLRSTGAGHLHAVERVDAEEREGCILDDGWRKRGPQFLLLLRLPLFGGKLAQNAHDTVLLPSQRVGHGEVGNHLDGVLRGARVLRPRRLENLQGEVEARVGNERLVAVVDAQVCQRLQRFPRLGDATCKQASMCVSVCLCVCVR